MSYTSREVVASAARTTSGNSGALTVGGPVAFGAPDTIALLLNVSAVSGTSPSMSVSVEWSMDGTNWAVGDPADAFTAAFTAAGARVRLFDVKAAAYRVVWAITGTTPSFTFTVHELANVD